MEKLKELGIPINGTYVLIVVSVFYVSTRLIRANTSHIFALMLATFGVYIVWKKTQESISNFNETLDVKMALLGDPPFLYMDANLINLFHDILPWRTKAPNNFDLALKAVGNVLKIERDAEGPMTRCADQFSLAREQEKLAMNLVHSFVYVLDNKVLVEKLKVVLQRLHQLLERHMATISRHCDAKERAKDTPDINTGIINFNGPFARDPAMSSHFDVY